MSRANCRSPGLDRGGANARVSNGPSAGTGGPVGLPGADRQSEHAAAGHNALRAGRTVGCRYARAAGTIAVCRSANPGNDLHGQPAVPRDDQRRAARRLLAIGTRPGARGGRLARVAFRGPAPDAAFQRGRRSNAVGSRRPGFDRRRPLAVDDEFSPRLGQRRGRSPRAVDDHAATPRVDAGLRVSVHDRRRAVGLLAAGAVLAGGREVGQTLHVCRHRFGVPTNTRVAGRIEGTPRGGRPRFADERVSAQALGRRPRAIGSRGRAPRPHRVGGRTPFGRAGAVQPLAGRRRRPTCR